MSHGSGDFFKHQASCFDGGRVGIEGRESGGNQVGIDKVRALGFGGKEGAGEGGFAGTVGSDDDPALPSSHLPCDVGNKRTLIAD